jgi:hypothetical protein
VNVERLEGVAYTSKVHQHDGRPGLYMLSRSCDNTADVLWEARGRVFALWASSGRCAHKSGFFEMFQAKAWIHHDHDGHGKFLMLASLGSG